MTTARTHTRSIGRGTKPPSERELPASAEDFLTLGLEAPDDESDDESDDSEPLDPSGLDYDPGDYNVNEVKAYVEANPETVGAILELEDNGKKRPTLLDWLVDFEVDAAVV